MKKSIAIDFDGVIHQYRNGWKDGQIYDEPVPYVFEAIQHLMKDYTVFVLTTRDEIQVHEWVRKHIMDNEGMWKYGYSCGIIINGTKFWNTENVLGITNIKLPAEVYIDDRALKFKGDWSRTLPLIHSFRTYQQPAFPVIEEVGMYLTNFTLFMPEYEYSIPHSTFLKSIKSTIIKCYERMGYHKDSKETLKAIRDLEGKTFFNNL